MYPLGGTQLKRNAEITSHRRHRKVLVATGDVGPMLLRHCVLDGLRIPLKSSTERLYKQKQSVVKRWTIWWKHRGYAYGTHTIT